MQQRWILSIGLVVACVAGTAHAQPASDPVAAAYQEARRLYDLREWDQAIAKFKEAYRLRPEARSLFNIAQAYRLKGDCVEATSFYRTFKRNYPDQQTAKVDRFLVELEPCAKQQAAAKAEPVKPAVVLPVEPTKVEPTKVEPANPAIGTTDPTKLDPAKVDPAKVDPAKVDPAKPDPAKLDPAQPEPVTLEPAPVDEPRSPGRTQRIAGLTIAGAGVIAVGVGTAFGLKARGFSRDAQAGEGPWRQAVEDNGKSAEKKAIGLWAIGGAAILGGGVLYFLGYRSGEAPSVAIIPNHEGASVVWSCEL